MILIADTQERRAAVAGRSLARVGAYYTEASITAKKNAINADELALEQSSKAYYDKAAAAKKDRLSKGTCTGSINPSTGYNDCLTNEEIRFVQWKTQFTQWQFDFNAYTSGGISIANSGQLDTFDDRLKVLRKSFQEITGATLPVPSNPSDPGPLGGLGGGGAPGASLFDTLERLVWVGGILLIGYFGFVYILPAFLGAGATARSARRSYQEA